MVPNPAGGQNPPLSVLKQELDQLDSALAAKFRALEEALADKRLGVTLAFEFSDCASTITFEKLNDRWRLLVNQTPISDVPRDVRAHVASHVADLVETISGRLAEKVRSRRVAIEAVHDAIIAIGNA